MDADRVLGVDGCKAGWVGIAWSGGVDVRAYVAPTIAELAAAAGAVSVIAIDIPIGLPDTGRRAADLAARTVVGARRSSVFMTPVRAALRESRHDRASAINREHAGEGMSIQVFGLLPKIRQVDDWLPNAPCRVVEVHPEVSFAQLAGEPLTVRKNTWAGTERRRALLAAAGLALSGDLPPAGDKAAVDDILDAAAAAWTAHRVHHGRARPLPDPPQRHSDGIESAIWR